VRKGRSEFSVTIVGRTRRATIVAASAFSTCFVRGTWVAHARAAMTNKIPFFLLLLAAAACGSSSSSDDSKPGTSSSSTEPLTTCSGATKKMCERACECGSGGKCVVAYVGDGGLAVTEEHDSLSDCEDFYSFMVCGNAQYAKDYEAPGCGDAIAAASCVTAQSKPGLAFPPTCHASK
jgi:hypothetical protein